MKAQQDFGAVVEEGGVGMVSLSDDQEGVKRVSLVGMAGFHVDAGEEAGNGGVVRNFGVKGFDERSGLGRFGGVAGVEVGLGELGSKAGIAGRVGEGGNEQGFGLGGVVLGEQDVSEGGGGLRVVGGDGEVAAVGALCGREVEGGFGDLGGEEDVVRLLGGQFESREEAGGCVSSVGRRGVLRIAVQVEASQGAVGTGFESRGGVVEGGGGGELGAGLDGTTVTGEQEAEGDVWGGKGRAGGYGFAV